MNTINGRTNRVIKMAPNKITKKDVPYLRSLTKDASSCMKKQPKYSIGDIVRISKADTTFRKRCKQTFRDELFEIIDTQTINPPTYKLLNKTAEPIFWKFYVADLNKAVVRRVSRTLKQNSSYHTILIMSQRDFGES